jgi:formimidoylglutamate deiminase
VPTLYKPDLLLQDGRFVSGAGLLVDNQGRVAQDGDANLQTAEIVLLPGRALLPGLVNAHSHSFQRLIRGRSETRGGDFWSWRGVMYAAAAHLAPEDLYDVSRMAFLEMALAGITTVGEFHYVQRRPDGGAYADPNELAQQVIAAARSVGLRICLLRVAYFRAGYGLPPDAGQLRFYERPEEFLAACQALHSALEHGSDAWMGVAPHSVRAVPVTEIEAIAEYARSLDVPLHLHAAEQRGELEASMAEYGMTPVRLLGERGILSAKTTLVHAVHVDDAELDAMAAAGVTICACPTTERNLGDGIVRARDAARLGINLAFGTDSQAQIDLLEDARALEYHLRLQSEQRLLLDQIGGSTLAQRVFGYATQGGANSLQANAGTLAPGEWADFFTVDLKDPAIAGVAQEHLLAAIVFTQQRGGIRDVAVKGRRIVRDGVHPLQNEIVAKYADLSRRVWKIWENE